MSGQCVSGAVGGVSHRGGEPARPSLTHYLGDSPMRKPRLVATRTIVLATLTLILVASCSEKADRSLEVRSTGSQANAAGGVAGFVGRDAPRGTVMHAP